MTPLLPTRYWPNFFRSLAAVLIGNAIYFLVLMPYLPPRARHSTDRIDFGLLIDFWICVLVWGIIALLARRRR